MRFLEWKSSYYDWSATEICSPRFNQQHASICPDNGLTPKKWQAIMWTDDGLVYCRIYTPLDHDEFTCFNGYRRTTVRDNTCVDSRAPQYLLPLWCSITTVKPVYNDHLMGYFSAFWSSSRWPRATQMSSRRQIWLARVNWYLQSSLKHITE